MEGIKIELSKEKAEEYFYNSLCNGLSYFGGYGLQLDFKKSEYKKSAAKLKNPCYEDVFMQMLRDGYKLKVIDNECEGAYTKSIAIKDVHERVGKTEITHLMDMINENDDATTADCILQTVFFEEIIFG